MEIIFHANIKRMKIAKIIFGAKNTDTKKLKEVVEIYAKASADIFDVCADAKIIKIAKNVIAKLSLDKAPLICASITLNNDKHSQKAKINDEKCCKCTRCVNICPQKTIDYKKGKVVVKTAGCVGCGKCQTVCPNAAMKLYSFNQSFEEQFEQAKIADYIEIHTNGQDENLFEVFEFLNQNYNGEIGICISQNPNAKEKIKIIKKIRDIILPKKLIVQADGNAISGFDNEIKTTQKAIEECKNFQNIENIIIIASGGTNLKTAELARSEGIRLDGIAWGSYARKILFEEENLTKSVRLNKARELINTIK